LTKEARHKSARRGRAAESDLEAKEPLEGREREQHDVEREEDGEAAEDLRVDAKAGEGIHDGLVEVRRLRIEPRAHELRGDLFDETVVCEDAEGGVGEHTPALEPCVDGGDDGHQIPSHAHRDKVERRVDEGGHPVVEGRVEDVPVGKGAGECRRWTRAGSGVAAETGELWRT